MRILGLLLLPVALAAQQPDTACTLSGRVINAVSSEPVRRAFVSIRRIDASPGTTTSRAAQAVSTDATGNFAIGGVEPGTYRLSAEHNGFLPAQYGARAPGKPGTTIVLGKGEKSTGLQVALYPHGVITGRVLDDEGEPVANAEVQISRQQYMQGRKQFVASGRAGTNDLGEYRVFGIAPGRYYVSAGYRPANTSPEAITTADGIYVNTWFPRTADPAAAAPIDVVPGAQLRNVDVMMTRARTVHVKGRVINEVPPLNPGLGATRNLNVILSSNNPLGMGMGNSRGAQVDGDGAFEFRDIVPGTYLLVAMASMPGRAYTARLPLVVGATNIEGVALTIHTPVSVSGTVTVDGETTEDVSKLRIGLQPWQTSGTVFGPMPDVQLRPDHSFQISDLSADQYRVTFYSLPDGFYVKSVRSGTTDVQLAGLDLSSGAANPLSIVISPRAPQLTGTVLDPKTQKPVPAVVVVAVPQEKERRDRESFYATVSTDQAGHFSLKNLTPGDYKVFSFEDVPYGSWMDPEFLAANDSKGEAVSVREGSPQSIQINLIE